MKILRLAASSAGSTETGHSLRHHPVSKPGNGIFDTIKNSARNKIEEYKAQAREEKAAEQVLQMDTSMLKDIGLSHSDRDSLKAGLTSLKELNSQRDAYRCRFN